MRKLIAAINMTLDGYCDHTAVIADEDLHQHYSALLRSGDTILYGRITYQLMEYWQTLLENPSGNASLDEFAVAMDNISKIVFSRTLKHIDWSTARLATRGLSEEVIDLKQQPGKDIFVGSPSLIVSLMDLGFIDEYQLCVHPVVAGSGLPLFKGIGVPNILKLIKTKTLGGGAIVLYYEPIKNNIDEE